MRVTPIIGVWSGVKEAPTPKKSNAGIILFMRQTNERRRYIVTSSLIGWGQTKKWSLVMWTACPCHDVITTSRDAYRLHDGDHALNIMPRHPRLGRYYTHGCFLAYKKMSKYQQHIKKAHFI